MGTTGNGEVEDTAGQSTRRRVPIVPHTHWDRQCSGPWFEQVKRGRKLVRGYAYERTFAVASGLLWRR
jgi:hypothetical protein